MDEGIAQWGAGDLKQPFERPVELEDQEYRTGNRKRTDEEGDDHGCVPRRKEAEAGEDEAEPKNQHHQEWAGIALPVCSNSSQRMCARSMAVSSAWSCSER